MAAFQLSSATISVIVPTIGRPASLRRLLDSLAAQTVKLDEVIVADGSGGALIGALAQEELWRVAGLNVRALPVAPPNAVRQRQVAINESCGEYLLLLDDDVALEPRCVEEILKTMTSAPDVVAVAANFNSQTWPAPTHVWRLYLRWFCGLREGEWQGRVIGPLLRFGYNPCPANPVPMEWLGAGMSLIKRSAYDEAGGFSNFFLHRCTMNEDVDLGLKLTRVGRILFCPKARMGHFNAPGGRVSQINVAEDDLYNRYLIMHRTQGRSALSAFCLVLLYFTIETASNLGGCFRRLRTNSFGERTIGRVRALFRILLGKAPLEANA